MSIDCRLGGLIASVDAASDLGRLKTGLLKRLKSAKTRTERAQILLGEGRQSTARRSLGGVLSSVATFEQRLQSNNARRIVPAGTRATLLAGADAIRTDLQTLLKSL